MKSKTSRNYGIVGLALLVLAVCLILLKKPGEEHQTQTSATTEPLKPRLVRSVKKTEPTEQVFSVTTRVAMVQPEEK